MRSIHWENTPPTTIDGGFVDHVMMYNVDEEWVSDALPCLNYLSRFSRRSLRGGLSRSQEVESGRSESWFVTHGAGTLILNKEPYSFKPGDAFVVPDGSQYQIEHIGDEPLSFYVSSEKYNLSRNSHSASGPSLGHFRESPMGMAHWHHRGYQIHGNTDCLHVIECVAIIEMLPLSPSEPHTHDTSFDEIWCMWRGKGIHVVDTELCHQDPGLAVCVTPNDLGHHLINHTETPLLCYYVRTASNLV